MSVYGLSPLGTGLGPFGGPGLITVLGVLPLSNNKFVVVFDVEPQTLDPQAYTSATNEDNYTLAAVDPTLVASDGTKQVPKGEVVPTRFPFSAVAEQDAEDDKQIIVAADSALEPHVRYDVTISTSICGADGESFAGPTVFRFRAPLLSPTLSIVQTSEQRYRDFDYTVNAGPGESEQVYRIEANNDIAIQDAALSLRKRIYRRVFTDPGGFAFAPGYGVGVKVKRLAKAGAMQDLANTITQQILQEPDVINAATDVSIDNTTQGTFINVDTRVQRNDARTVQIRFSEPLS